jgi:hypothetical protein
MQGISFSRINTRTYNTFLCIVFPLVAIAVLAENIPAFLNNFSLKWLFSLESLQGIIIFMCYAVPITYFLAKAYEMVISGEDKSRANTILGFVACCVLVLPLVLIGLAMFAKISLFIPIAFTAAIIFIYFRSYKPATV